MRQRNASEIRLERRRAVTRCNGSSNLTLVERTKSVNVAAILQAVYRRPEPLTNSLATRVRARLSLLETAAECVRLLVESPVSALNATVNSHAETASSDADESS
jgi:hypothetical protein